MIISGERFAFGYHYLRPNETYHEPTRKFFRNEVFRIPIYEVLPLETIWHQCWVMDIPTFCKGRPIGSVEEHVYICEYRVDKKARLFDKIPKTSGKGKKSKSNDLSFCTKWFAFDMFDVRLKPSRNYAVSYQSIEFLFFRFKSIPLGASGEVFRNQSKGEKVSSLCEV